MRGRAAFIALAGAAVLAALWIGRGRDEGTPATTGVGGGATTAAQEAPKGAVHIRFAYSPEKEGMLVPLVRRFNDAAHEVDGKRVFVDAENMSSGAVEAQLAAGKLKLDAWSPSSSLWGRLLNFEADRSWVPDDNPSIVRTPLVIAMWEPLARALGWPLKPVGFRQILALATSGQGWAQYGKPTYGQFKLGHTNPDFSTSGLSFVAAQYYTSAGKLEGLTEQDVNRGAVRAKVRQIERSIVHYGDTTLFFADQLKANGPAYASAVAMEEATLIDFNRTRPRGLERLVALYPEEGTFVSDNPFIVLDAPWVTDAQKRGAELFARFLGDEVTPKVAAAYGFRPGDVHDDPVAPITAANGVDPAQPERVLELPSPRVLATIKRAWRQDRKPANVLLVVDISGSMGENGKLVNAKQGLQLFLRRIAPQDRVGLIYFNEDVHPGVPIARFSKNAPQLRAQVRDLVSFGGTALYDATIDAWRRLVALRDEERINAVVVLSDGADTESTTKLKTVRAEIERRSESLAERRVRIFTIAYSAEENVRVLESITDASGGKAYEGDPKDIEAVYLQISSFF